MQKLDRVGDTQVIQAPQARPIDADFASNDASSLHMLGQNLAERGDLSAALDCLRKAADIQPQRSGLLIDLGDILFRDKKFSEAVAAYQRAQDLSGPNWKIFEKLADVYLAQGEICEAIDALELGFVAGVDDSVIAAMNVAALSPEMIAIKKKLEALLKQAESSGISLLRMAHGWYVPRSDINCANGFVGLPRYNDRPISDLEHAKLCIAKSRRHGLALDIGGNVGCWSWILADYFEQVQAFEPLPILQQCFMKNITKENVVLNKFAIGPVSGLAEMAIFDMATGASFITATMPDDRPSTESDDKKLIVKKLDDLNFQDVDFIKIDTEGFEAFVVQGAIETITRCKPVMYVEQVWGARYGQGAQHDAVRILMSLGATATQLGDGSNFLIEWP